MSPVPAVTAQPASLFASKSGLLAAISSLLVALAANGVEIPFETDESSTRVSFSDVL
jgi:hypothetical protein